MKTTRRRHAPKKSVRHITNRLKKAHAIFRGFTIIELLIVLVVVGIIAAVILVSYRGIQDRAVAAEIKSDLKGASTQLSLDKVSRGNYPATKEEANAGKGLSASTGVNLQYTYTATDDSYCLTASSNQSNSRPYRVSSTNTSVEEGVCPGHTVTTVAGTGYGWAERTSAGSRAWSSIAMSADGTRLVATVSGGGIYTSSNGGMTWSELSSAGSQAWSSIAMSADGTKLIASVSSGYVYTSSDAGATWTQHAWQNGWRQVAASSSGSRLVAVGGCTATTSTDSGVTWSNLSTLGCNDWRSVAVSGDGTKIIVGAWDGTVKRSIDGGTSWITYRDGSHFNGPKVAASRDGSKFAIGAGSMAMTADDGATWQYAYIKWVGWSAIALSDSGQVLMSAMPSTHLHAYTYGSDFITQSNSGERNWSAVAMSADGSQITAAVNGGYLYQKY